MCALVTVVQTCALPILHRRLGSRRQAPRARTDGDAEAALRRFPDDYAGTVCPRADPRRRGLARGGRGEPRAAAARRAGHQAAGGAAEQVRESGRASCREKVRVSEMLTVVRVSVKKK